MIFKNKNTKEGSSPLQDNDELEMEMEERQPGCLACTGRCSRWTTGLALISGLIRLHRK